MTSSSLKPTHQRSISSELFSGYIVHSASLDVFVLFEGRVEFNRACRDEVELGFKPAFILWSFATTSYKADSVSLRRCSKVLRYPPGSPLHILVNGERLQRQTVFAYLLLFSPYLHKGGMKVHWLQCGLKMGQSPDIRYGRSPDLTACGHTAR